MGAKGDAQANWPISKDANINKPTDSPSPRNEYCSTVLLVNKAIFTKMWRSQFNSILFSLRKNKSIWSFHLKNTLFCHLLFLSYSIQVRWLISGGLNFFRLEGWETREKATEVWRQGEDPEQEHLECYETVKSSWLRAESREDNKGPSPPALGTNKHPRRRKYGALEAIFTPGW